MKSDIHKEVTITLELNLEEMTRLVSMLQMLDREVLQRMPGDPTTSKYMQILDDLESILERGSR
jgi:hypothetical protein